MGPALPYFVIKITKLYKFILWLHCCRGMDEKNGHYIMKLPMHTRAVESEGFSTERVAENFNGSGQTFCSPIVIVCATNVCKRHTWQFKQLDASTRDDHGYSDRRQRTNLHTFTQGPFQISSVPWARHATYTL